MCVIIVDLSFIFVWMSLIDCICTTFAILSYQEKKEKKSKDKKKDKKDKKKVCVIRCYAECVVQECLGGCIPMSEFSTQCFFVFICFHQDKKSSKDYLENAVSGDKEDDFGSDGEENGTTEHVDDANAMGELALLGD